LLLRTVVCVAALLALPNIVLGQTPTAQAGDQPDDTPSIKLGATIFTNYTYQTDPKIVDTDGNTVNKSSFDVTRGFINVTGNINHMLTFRLTPDVVRETSVGSSLNGSLVFRLTYAYLQASLDRWLPSGSYVRFGAQQTPYLDYTESLYRYRFQGTTFAERAGYLALSDFGASFHLSLPSDYGDLHVGVFNGESVNKPEVNNQKAFMVRGTIRPFAQSPTVLHGFRATGFIDSDSYVMNGERQRLIGQLTFEHELVNAGFEYLDAKDQLSAKVAANEGKGYSIWVTPKSPIGWEGLIRYDHLRPNTSSLLAPVFTALNGTTMFSSQQQNRLIVGIAYWLPHRGTVSSAVLVDYDGQRFVNVSGTPTKTIGVHALVNF
jgi:hypothetical protein